MGLDRVGEDELRVEDVDVLPTGELESVDSDRLAEEEVVLGAAGLCLQTPDCGERLIN